MIGSIRWNLSIAAVFSLLIFLFNLFDNIIITTLLRSVFGFALMFLLVFLFRWFLGTIVGMKQLFPEQSEEVPAEEAHKGANIDLTTPQEDDLNRLIKEQLQGDSDDIEGEFSPINPPKLASKEKLDPEELARAIRRMSGEEGW